MFYCHECKDRFALVWKSGESEEEYTRRLATTLNAPCPRCGLICERCVCRKGAANG